MISLGKGATGPGSGMFPPSLNHIGVLLHPTPKALLLPESQNPCQRVGGLWGGDTAGHSDAHFRELTMMNLKRNRRYVRLGLCVGL